MSLLMACVLAVIILGLPMAKTSADQKGGQDLGRVLQERYQSSGIEMSDVRRLGEVTRTGKLLVLAADAVPAKPFRVIQADARSPRVHVMDFARVDISAGGTMTAEPGPLMLRQGTRLVVLDMRFTGSEVHLLTHTAEPAAIAVGEPPLYGCTELVFHLDPRVAAAGDAGRVIQAIERVVAWTPQGRFCAQGIEQLCLEP